MTQLDFYSLPDLELNAITQLTCKLLEKATLKNQQVLIQVNDEDDACQLSEKIWGFKPESFLAHGVLNEHSKNQIEIGWTNEHGKQHDVLIQLADNIPEFFSRFDRVIEITCGDSNNIAMTRDHYRYYRDRGYPIRHHKLKSVMGNQPHGY